MFRSTSAKIIAIGIVAGMRSMSAPLFASIYARDALPGSRLGLLGAPSTARTLKALAASELIADKLPIGARIAAGPLLARVASGAVSGALICAADSRRPEIGALLGGLAALAGTFGFYHLRKRIGRSAAVPDRALGVAEDALVLGIGHAALGGPREHWRAEPRIGKLDPFEVSRPLR